MIPWRRSFFALACALFVFFGGCARDRVHTVRISVHDQQMVVLRKGVPIATYDVSTSKFGVGDRPGSGATPLGRLEVARKIGAGAPIGMKFKNRKPTGEIVPIDAPGRDPIVTRILWLKGLEPRNRRAFGRTIYIHGTAEERKIGKPASYGCIRMRSRDVVSLFKTVGVGARVEITTDPLTSPSQRFIMTPEQRKYLSQHAVP
ncbi:MAG TPA: L,D-transpeptidase [Chthoniobacteraceae bacterium]|nr:L,D-transpeptidase [Chthoniobacteraceae bacterium]